MAERELTNANLWTEWFPESRLADLLAGDYVEANIGQVRGVYKAALEREVRAGRLTKWRGRWYPEAGAPVGTGPLKDCYGSPKIAARFAEWRQSLKREPA